MSNTKVVQIPDSLYRTLLFRVGMTSRIVHGADETGISMPEMSKSYLRNDNPYLSYLRAAYEKIDLPVTRHSRWNPGYVTAEVSLTQFRDDGPFMWQARDMNGEVHYLLTYYYLASMDDFKLFAILHDDYWFGVRGVMRGSSQLLTRDLLDSISQLYFLQRSMKIAEISELNVLDIGAGYGRLAHRMALAVPNIAHIFCVDTIAESTFLCGHYLSIRGVQDKATSIEFPKITEVLKNNRIDLAINVNCFPECSLDSIVWWLKLLRQYNVRYLFVAPNAEDHQGTRLVSLQPDGQRIDFGEHIQREGYRLSIKEPKYLDPLIQRYGVSPTHYYLFELA